MREPMVPENFYNLTELANLVGRTRTALVYAAKIGALGKPRLVGTRKVYSLARAEARYHVRATPEQQQSVRKVKANHDQQAIVQLVNLALKVRDQLWRETLERQGISRLRSPAEQQS